MFRQCPQLLEMLAPVQFIVLQRQDKVAQAVSLAKALQSRAWFSFDEERRPPLFYSREFIEQCLKEVLDQEAQWLSWLQRHGHAYLTLQYEEILRDPSRVVTGVVEYLGLSEEPRREMELPMPRKQSDEVNADWIRRFNTETSRARV
jgi:LPS sulfotransferase NodH